MKFKVEWYKTYRRFGSETIEANTYEEAKLKAYDQLGNFEGSIQYFPDESEVTLITELNKNE